MKSKSSLIALSFSLLMVGCASTNPDLPTENGQVVFPALELASNTTYKWDDSKSEALNIAHMALPAKVGNGLTDMSDGKRASTGKIGGGSRLFDGAMGLAGFGLFGVLQSESLTAGVNSALDWKPSIVEIMPYDGINIDYSNARNLVMDKVKAALNESFPGIKFGDALTLKGGLEKPTAWLQVYSEEICKEARPFESRKKDVGPFTKNNLSQVYYDGENKIEEYCAIGFDFTAAQPLSSNEVVIVAEMSRGLSFAPYLSKNYDGYMIFPDMYDINSAETVLTKYPFVSHKGEELLFQTPE
jgi:hypothetical protein